MANTTNPIPRTSPFFKPPKGNPTEAAGQSASDPVIDALSASFGAALTKDFGTDALPNPDGWVLTGIGPRKVDRLGACATFTHQGRTLRALVSPTDSTNESPYFRTSRYDMARYYDR